MLYCVLVGTETVIYSGNDEKNIKNTVLKSYKESEIEIITEEELKNRKSNEESEQQTTEERIKNLEGAVEDLAHIISELAEGGTVNG